MGYHTGGLYVATQFSESNYIALNRGIVVVHQGDLYHGVQLCERKSPDGKMESDIVVYS